MLCRRTTAVGAEPLGCCTLGSGGVGIGGGDCAWEMVRVVLLLLSSGQSVVGGREPLTASWLAKIVAETFVRVSRVACWWLRMVCRVGPDGVLKRCDDFVGGGEEEVVGGCDRHAYLGGQPGEGVDDAFGARV